MTFRWSAAALVVLAAVGVAATDKELVFIGARAKYWAFQKVVQPVTPEIKDPWVRTPIDAFILQDLQKKQLTPSPSLDRIQLIRRVTYDLTGLPPTPEEVRAFVKDKSADAYEKVVDRLLASPHYGESAGQRNGWTLFAMPTPTDSSWTWTGSHAWRYRDYVIRSFNADKPYDALFRSRSPATRCSPATRKRWSPPAICAPVRSTWCPATSIPRKAARRC